MESIYVQWQHDHILITNPGGFMEGITTENILVHEPKPRNTRLAEAFKRIGITDQTGRGVDKIYLGQVRYGRPPPDYSRSDSSAVRVVIPGGESSLDFAAFIFEEERNGEIFSLDDLLVINKLNYDQRIDAPSAGELIQKGPVEGRRVLEHLHELGLVEEREERSGRVYQLPASLYKRFHMKAEYLRAKGFEPLQQEQMVIEFVKEHGKIKRADVTKLCKINDDQAKRLLKSLTEKYAEFKQKGVLKSTYYIWDTDGT
jgi:ATP-dependent DNA helicase RecG